MPRRVIIGVGLASYPLYAGGLMWSFLPWVLGFREAGWDVWMVEDVPRKKCIDASEQACAPEQSANLAYWNKIVAEFNLQGRATLFFDGQSPDLNETLKFARDADMFLNISGHFRQQDILGAVRRRRVYVDTDPAFTQIWAENYNCDMNLAAHDTFASIGRHIGSPGCRAPHLGRTWLPAAWPVIMEHFTLPNVATPGDTWTTVTHWYGYPEVIYDGQSYGNKSEEFAKLVNLPHKTKEKLEIATDLHPEDRAKAQFQTAGWSITEARPHSTPWQNYRDYLAQSQGEFCVAKNGYVRSRCGWFSDRSVCYLALGRPVILQDTGWTDFYPHGEGLLAYHDEDSAAAALEAVGKDPLRHARAARAIAEKYCAAPIVINELVESIERGE